MKPSRTLAVDLLSKQRHLHLAGGQGGVHVDQQSLLGKNIGALFFGGLDEHLRDVPCSFGKPALRCPENPRLGAEDIRSDVLSTGGKKELDERRREESVRRECIR
ncbi:hypothetical protein EYF80_055394 [Liparis tanakae]|uniref:Uncharacterized protein n=1 Tax=Liparis tanakae TaxID=230148 RepID=A0A4Z2EZR2_9TELE|nr:hypothetical protein EYF80_055394 [Liparis tanakae]